MDPFHTSVGAMLLLTLVSSTTTSAMNSTSSLSLSSACDPAACGGVRITYPFWLGGTHPPECGHRAFQVRCDRNDTASLKNSILTYKILDISYDDRSFRVTNVELSDETCNVGIQLNASSDLGLAPFSNSTANQELFFLYNCIDLQAGRRPPTWAPCANNSFAWLARGYKPDDKWAPVTGNCSVSMVPVLGYPGATGADYRRLKKGGFRLEYTAGNCAACEESGGLCRIDTYYDIFKCLCSDGMSDLMCGELDTD